MTEPQTFRQFFLRSWLFSLMLDIVLTALCIFFYMRFLSFHGTRSLFMLCLAAVIVAGVHALLLLVFSVRRFSRKQALFGFLFFVHAFYTGALTYSLFYAWFWGLFTAHK